MNELQKQLYHNAIELSDKCALKNDDASLSYSHLYQEINNTSQLLSRRQIALFMDNSLSWAVLDLAAFFAKKCTIPLPIFFSNEQLKHSIADAGINIIFTDQAQRIRDLKLNIQKHEKVVIAQKTIDIFYLDTKSDTIAEDICKITYTSGTTGTPKGVMLTQDNIISKVKSLASASCATRDDVSFSILPLSTLLENIAGLYVPLFCGATAYLPSPESIGLNGSSQIEAEKLLAGIKQIQPTAFIIIPQLLLLFIQAVKNGYTLPENLRFVAVGGAPVSDKLLMTAMQLLIPVYQGYGLSEAASVVSLNNQQNNKPGSVGKVLPMHQLKIANDGQVLIKKNMFKGYLGQVTQCEDDYYASGDIGTLDKDGYLYIHGRIKNVINTSYGRNISPEWLEKELEALSSVAQAIVYGHAKPFITALIVLRQTQYENLFQEQIKQLNSSLPDYARIKDYLLISQLFSLANQQLTGTGRPVRKIIYQYYQASINQLYEKSA